MGKHHFEFGASGRWFARRGLPPLGARATIVFVFIFVFGGFLPLAPSRGCGFATVVWLRILPRKTRFLVLERPSVRVT